jgi:amidase
MRNRLRRDARVAAGAEEWERGLEDVLLEGSVAAIRRAVGTKKVSIREIAAWYLARIEAFNRSGPALNAVRIVLPDVLEVARRLDDELAAGRDRGPLHGIPVLLKDNILTGDGMTATAGAAALLNFVPRRDATLVRRLREAGAVILGKTNLTEFADYVSDVMPSGFSGAGGMVRNPHGKEGYGRGLGSSVGSAAAVAASLAPIALGSETQNSIQTPACVSSVFGFKPSVGMVSRAGVVPLVPSQDSPGPLARSLEDAAVLLAVIAGADCRDGATLSVALDRPAAVPAGTPNSIRLGVPRRTIVDRTDLAGVMPCFEAAISELAKAGVTIVDPCDLPSAEQLQDVRSSVFRTEFKAALNAFLEDNDRPCGIGSIEALIKWNEEHREAIPYGQSLLIAASQTDGLENPSYRADRKRDIALSRQAGIDAALQYSGADALIAPMSAAAKCTGKAGAPVLAIPVGTDADGVPFSVTLFTSWGKDAALLEAGAAIAAIIGDRVVPKL